MIARVCGTIVVATFAVLGCDGSRRGGDPHVLASAGQIVVLAGFAPEPVTPDVAALYFTLRNDGPRTDRLLAVGVEVAERATIHRQAADGMTTRMEPVASLELPAKQTVALTPGGLHVMLEDVRQAYEAGDSLLVTLTLERAGTLEFVAPVISYAEVDHQARGRHENR